MPDRDIPRVGGSREQWSVSPLGLLPKRRGGAEYGEAGDERVGALQHRLMNEVAGLAAHNDKQLHHGQRRASARGRAGCDTRANYTPIDWGPNGIFAPRARCVVVHEHEDANAQCARLTLSTT